MRGKTDKQSVQRLAAGIFTGAMVLLCAALYFFTGGAVSSSLSRTGGAAPSPSPSPAPEPLAAAEDFVRGKGYYEFLKEENGARVYLLQADEAQGTLTLSVTERGVTELVFGASCPEKPQTIKAGASALEQMLYDKRLASYEAQKSWLGDECASLVGALGPLSRSDQESFLFALDSTISDGKSKELACASVGIRIHCYESGEEPLVVSAYLLEP